jgi:hypothetical protein
LKIPKPAQATNQLLVGKSVFFRVIFIFSVYGTELLKMIGITTIKTNTVMNYDLIPRNYVVIED